MTRSKELIFFIENFTGHNNDIKEMSKPNKHARTYMNRFTINEDDQYEISKVQELNSDWAFKDGPRSEDISNRINEAVKAISAESLDVFLFGWYEFEGKTGKNKSERQRYKRRIYIRNTLFQEMVSYIYNSES